MLLWNTATGDLFHETMLHSFIPYKGNHLKIHPNFSTQRLSKAPCPSEPWPWCQHRSSFSPSTGMGTDELLADPVSLLNSLSLLSAPGHPACSSAHRPHSAAVQRQHWQPWRKIYQIPERGKYCPGWVLQERLTHEHREGILELRLWLKCKFTFCCAQTSSCFDSDGEQNHKLTIMHQWTEVSTTGQDRKEGRNVLDRKQCFQNNSSTPSLEKQGNDGLANSTASAFCSGFNLRIKLLR